MTTTTPPASPSQPGDPDDANVELDRTPPPPARLSHPAVSDGGWQHDGGALPTLPVVEEQGPEGISALDCPPMTSMSLFELCRRGMELRAGDEDIPAVRTDHHEGFSPPHRTATTAYPTPSCSATIQWSNLNSLSTVWGSISHLPNPLLSSDQAVSPRSDFSHRFLADIIDEALDIVQCDVLQEDFGGGGSNGPLVDPATWTLPQ